MDTPRDAKIRIETFLDNIRRRNRREIVAGMIMLPVFGAFAALASSDSIVFYGHLLVIVAILFVVGMVKYIAAVRGDLISHPSNNIDHWAAEMHRQAKLLRGAFLWYLGPFLPGLTVLLLHGQREINELSVIPIMMVALVFAIVLWLNLRAASDLTIEANLLEEMEANCANEQTTRAD